jgi:outer membrane receptor protein involved in Fe transport
VTRKPDMQFRKQPVSRCAAQPWRTCAACPPSPEPTSFARQEHGGPKRISVLNYYNFHVDLRTRSSLSGHPSDATKYLIVSLTYANSDNTSWVPPPTVIDAMFGYFQHHWDAQIGIKNIGNVTYYMFAESAGGYAGEPRTYYVKAAWHF